MKFYVLLETDSDLHDDLKGKSFDEICEIIKKQAIDDPEIKFIGCYKEMPKVELEKIKPCKNFKCKNNDKHNYDGTSCDILWSNKLKGCKKYKP